MGDLSQLYEQDYYAWTQAQAASLRRVLERRVNLDSDLDLENLAEEIESMGRSDWRGLQSALERIIEHFLKLEYSPAQEPRAGWVESVANHRLEFHQAIDESPSLATRINVPRAWQAGRARAVASFRRYGDADLAVIAVDCPYSLEQLRDSEWFPVNRHGLT